MDEPQSSLRNLLQAAILRLCLFAVLWLVLTEGDIGSWPFGMAAVAIATWVSLRLLPPLEERVNPLALAWFVTLFLRGSFLGAVDVSWRAVHPRLPIRPTIVRYPLRLPPGPAQVFFSNVISLLPGSLGAGFEDNCLNVHWINQEQPITELLRNEEEWVAAVFGIMLPPQTQEDAHG